MKNKFLILSISLLIPFMMKAQNQKPMIKTASGLEYRIDVEGKGVKPVLGDKVVVHYTGKLTNDTVFDSSRGRNQPFTFVLGMGQVIKGWDEGIALLNVGSRATLKIPAQLGYGERDMGNIPPNSTLIFDVELLDVISGPKQYEMGAKQWTVQPSGVKYVIVKEGTGVKLQSGMKVTAHYSGYFEDGKMFDSSVPREQPISITLGKKQVIPGLEEGLSFLKVGDKAKIYIPYALAYGDAGRGTIPGKANLIFDMEIVSAVEAPKVAAYNTAGKDTLSTATGLKYIMVQQGTGNKAQAGKKVKVHYTGYLTDGSTFDSSLDRGEPIEFVLGQGQVIPGWDEGIQLLKVGDKARFIIPPAIGYGAQAMGPIPANSTLIFDVELVDVEK
ncbi:MAG: FKBP-type peptidyl-prolyl cis-trans isomerase [Bacteroidota bacterium]